VVNQNRTLHHPTALALTIPQHLPQTTDFDTLQQLYL